MALNKIKKIIGGSMEIISGAAKELGETVAPAALVEHALKGGQGKKDEMGEYLRNLDKDKPLTPEEIKAKEAQIKANDEAEINRVRQAISTTPAHMRPVPKPPELRVYDQQIREKEQEKEQTALIQKQSPLPLLEVQGKQQRGGLGKRRKAPQKGFEGLKKDSKAG